MIFTHKRLMKLPCTCLPQVLLLTVIEALREEKETNEEEKKTAILASSPSAPAAAPATYHGSAAPKQHGDIIKVSPLPPAHNENTEKCPTVLRADNVKAKGRFLRFFENSGNFLVSQISL